MRAEPGIVAIRVARRIWLKVVMASGLALDSQISRFTRQLGGLRLAIRKRRAVSTGPFRLRQAATLYTNGRREIRSALLSFDPAGNDFHDLIIDPGKAMGGPVFAGVASTLRTIEQKDVQILAAAPVSELLDGGG